MALSNRELRRTCGLLKARLPELKLADIEDPRSTRGRRWKQLDVPLRAVVLAIAAGRQSCKETETLSDDLSLTMRRELGIKRRIPDTTLRTTLCASRYTRKSRPLIDGTPLSPMTFPWASSRSMEKPRPSNAGTTNMRSGKRTAKDWVRAD